MNSGLRCTPQRLEVFEVVAHSGDHPTAEEIFKRAKRTMPDLSFATVYNCLSALVQHGLVRQVTLDRAPARFCPNMREHCHFYCDTCGAVLDIDLPQGGSAQLAPLPAGYRISSFDLSLRGTCTHCNESATKPCCN